MGKKVTLTTQGYDIELMLRFIPDVMVPEVCLITTVLASACFGTWQTSGIDCIAYGQSGLNSVGMLNSTPIGFALVGLHVAFEGFELYATPFWRGVVAYLGGFGFRRSSKCCSRRLALRTVNIALASFTLADSTLILKAVCPHLAAVKFVKSFSFFATRALFGKMDLRHGFFHAKKLCLELPAGYNPPAARFIGAHPTRFQATINTFKGTKP